MNKSSLFFFGVLLLLPASLAWAQVSPVPILPEQTKNISLVRAEVVEVQKHDGYTISTLKVLHAYSAPPSHQLKNRTFTVLSRTRAGSGTASILPIPHMGEIGIWLVTERGGFNVTEQSEKLFAYFDDPFYGFDGPVRKDVAFAYRPSPTHVKFSFEEAEILAAAVEDVVHSTPAESRTKLRTYALSSVPQLSAWAIKTLGSLLSPAEQKTVFRQIFPDLKVPVMGRLAADKELVRVEGQDWQNSDERRSFLRGLASQTLNEADAAALNHYLRQVSSLAPGTIIQLLEQLALNQTAPMLSRENALTILRWHAADAQQSNAALDFIISELQKGEEPDFQFILAQSLRGWHLSPEQVAAVKGLADKSQDPKVVAELRLTLPSLKERDSRFTGNSRTSPV